MIPHFTSEYYNEFVGHVKKYEYNEKRYGNSEQFHVEKAYELFGNLVEVKK